MLCLALVEYDVMNSFNTSAWNTHPSYAYANAETSMMTHFGWQIFADAPRRRICATLISHAWIPVDKSPFSSYSKSAQMVARSCTSAARTARHARGLQEFAQQQGTEQDIVCVVVCYCIRVAESGIAGVLIGDSGTASESLPGTLLTCHFQRCSCCAIITAM